MKRLAIRWRAITVIAIAFSHLFGEGAEVSAQKPDPAKPVARADLSPSDLFARSSPAIVTIETPSGLGSGVIVASDGLLVTNLHVIADSTSATVTLAKGDVYDNVKVAAVDARRDLALLRIPAYGLPIAAVADSDSLRVGDRVYAIGSPQGLELSLSEGLVSALRDSGDGYQVLQTTAAISPGSSGGGLFNSKGELVGITTFKIRGGENLNFALPVNYVRGLIGVADAEPMSLELVRRVYGPKETQRPATQTSPSAASASRSTQSEPRRTEGPFIPQLAISYNSTQSGGSLLISQRDNTARVTIYNSSYYIVGNAVVEWDSSALAYVGNAEGRFVCGSLDTRTTTVTSRIEYHPMPGGVLKERYYRPTGLNCSRGQVKGWTWTEDTWWPR